MVSQYRFTIDNFDMNDELLLKGYFADDGKIDRMPGKKQKKKLAAMLRYLAQQFEAGKQYSEKEVNVILNDHHNFNDPATFRRLLFTSGLINRTLDCKQYWLATEDE